MDKFEVTMWYMLFACMLFQAQSVLGQQEGGILGLRSHPNGFQREGLTDDSYHPKATGTLKAIMLFAKFPDADEDKTPRELHDHLVPGAVKFFKESSYGRFNLEVDAHYQWYAMKKPSTDPGYDCSRHDTHKAYVAEVISAADGDVDFTKYTVVYVVASRNKGTPISPTLHAPRGRGIPVDGHEIRHAVTFGNDSRNANWGWQTLVHETGHILGLPDLYNFDPVKGDYKSCHKFAGCWDPMGYQGHGSDFLAWHKYKLGWLDEGQFVIVKEGSVTREMVHIGTDGGVKAFVVPINENEAYVAEVKGLCASREKPGVLVYRVATHVESGSGPIKVIPAVEDDDKKNPELARKYVALYDALYAEGTRFEDTKNRARIDVLKKTELGFEVKVTR